MDYVTMYDVSQAGYRQWSFPAFGLIFVAASVVGLRYKTRLIRYPLCILIFSVVWTAGSFVGTFTDFYRLSAALRESRCEVVEGAVTDFQLLPPTGAQKAESFVVAGIPFKYSGYEATAGFNQMRSQGGSINNAMIVRIHYLDGEFSREIARLEVAAATR